MDQLSELKMKKVEDNEKYKITPNGANKKLISDSKSVIGSIIDNPSTGERRISIDVHKMTQHKLEATRRSSMSFSRRIVETKR
jgi:hypothetical protein